MANNRDVSGEIRGIVVQEIQNYLKPLVDKVDKQGSTLRSLYANGGGGPPGYLEMARAEDKEQAKRLFSKIDRVMERLDGVEDFITTHNAREAQREIDHKAETELIRERLEDAEKRSNRRIAMWMLALAVLMAIFSLWDHRDVIVHSLLEPAINDHSQLQYSNIPTLENK